MCKLPRLRTINKAYEHLKEQDPETDITEPMLRGLVAAGEIPCVYQGRKALVDIDTLVDKIAEWVARQAEQGAVPAERKRKSTGRPRSENYGNVRAI